MKIFLLIVRITLLTAICVTAQAQVFDIPFEGNASSRTLLLPAQNAKAVVLLFPGGGGMLNLQDNGSTRNNHTFVRSKDLWQQYGISAVLVDTPFDLGNSRNNIRFGDDHQQRIKSVVRFYKDKLKLPVWLMGHSMGTTSVAGFANRGKEWRDMVAGIVVSGTHATARLDDDVALPTLAVHHRLDGCKYDPVSASESIISSRPAGTRSQLTLIDGGENIGNPCLSMAYHGFNQREAQLVETAARFILNKQSNMH